MPEPDTRNATTILSTVEMEFRQALEAECAFFEWRADNPEAPFAEQLRRWGEWTEAGEPYAASYKRIRKAFPEAMDRLHELLLPIQRQILG
jgi:hypothetical protein